MCASRLSRIAPVHMHMHMHLHMHMHMHTAQRCVSSCAAHCCCCCCCCGSDGMEAVPVYLVGRGAALATAAVASLLEWLHPARMEHAFDGRPALVIADLIASGRCVRVRSALCVQPRIRGASHRAPPPRTSRRLRLQGEGRAVYSCAGRFVCVAICRVRRVGSGRCGVGSWSHAGPVGTASVVSRAAPDSCWYQGARPW